MDAPGFLGLLPLGSAPFSNTTMDARFATLLSILTATYVLSSIYTSNKNIHFEMILDVGIGEKRKETRFLI